MSSFATYPSLVDRSALITGGASGIGAAFVEGFARQGARVAFLDVDDASAASLSASLGDVPHAPYYLHCDLTDLDALRAAIIAARAQIGPIAVLVNNAANDARHALADIDSADFERNVAVSRHQIFATQAVIPDMRQLGGGSIICLGSTGWMKKNAGYPLYAMAKAAVHGFVNGMARELGQQHIRINSLVPGWAITDKQARLWLDDAGREEIARTQCMPGFLMAEDLARAALFLAADDSRMCTGQDFIVDGGWGMTTPTVLAPMDIALDAGNTLGEGIVWCARAQALYWTDIQRATLYRLHPASGVLEQWSMPERLASFALCETDGWLLLALASQLAFFRLADSQLQTLHEIEPGLPTRCNDGACDRQGRFVFGTMHEPVEGGKQTFGSFWRLNADLSLEQLALPKVAISNSIAFSPDGTTMYYCDSLSRCIQRCAYGDTLGTPQPFADLDELAGEPDGSCVDADGSLWNAQWGLARVVCYAADGSVRRVLSVPARQPTRPAFGGADLDTLYVTSARDGLSAAQLDANVHAGALFRSQVGVRGLPEPRFVGKPPVSNTP